MNSFVYIRAGSWPEAAKRIAAGGGKTLAKAGGIDLLDRMKEHLDEPERVVSLLSIPGAASIEISKDGAAKLGALVTVAELAHHAGLRASFRALTEAAATLATPAVRNGATLGGNLAQRPRCHYFRSELYPCLRKGGALCFAIPGDNRAHAIFDNSPCAAVAASSLAAPLCALTAKVSTIQADKPGRTLPLAELFVRASSDPHRELALEPGELITAIELPAPPPSTMSAYGKVRARESQDWPLVEVAAALSFTGDKIGAAQIFLGSVAMIPWRARAAEQALLGQVPSAELLRKAAGLCADGATPHSMNGYKVDLLVAEAARVLGKASGSAA